MYAIKNILQIEKSQLNAKLDKNLQNAVKNHAIKIKLFNSENTVPSDRKKDIEKKDNNSIDFFIANIYLHIIAITRIYQKE